MRYLHVISSLDPAGGGPAEGVRQRCRAVQQLGASVEVATLDSPDVEWAGESICPTHFLGPTRMGVFSYAPRLLPWLRINLSRFQAVVVSGLWQYHGFAVRQALQDSPIPYFVFPHGMLDPWFRRRYPLKHLKKWLYWPWGEYRVLRDARGVLFTSEEERLQARQSFPELYRAREIVVSYGTPGPPADRDPVVQRELFLDAWPQLRGQRILLFLGRIHPKKGCDLIIHTFAEICHRHPDLRLVIAGPGGDALAAGLLNGIPAPVSARIVWPGMLTGDAKWGAFHASEAFVLPSHQENFGIAVAEALACGKPVLISNKVNIWREIEEAGAGLVEADTAAGTQQLLARWLDLDLAQRKTMGHAARELFRARFRIDRAARDLLDILSSDTGHLSPRLPTT